MFNPVETASREVWCVRGGREGMGDILGFLVFFVASLKSTCPDHFNTFLQSGLDTFTSAGRRYDGELGVSRCYAGIRLSVLTFVNLPRLSQRRVK